MHHSTMNIIQGALLIASDAEKKLIFRMSQLQDSSNRYVIDVQSYQWVLSMYAISL